MSLMRRSRTEMAGAWRSLRYDLGHRADDRAAAEPGPGADVTSTGMSTFGGAEGTGRAEPVGHLRPPRRALAVTAFGTLALVGAAGSYFAVVNGLGALLGDEPAAPGPYPLAVAGDGQTGDADGTLAANAGMGQGVSATRPAPEIVVPTATGVVRVPPEKLALPAPRLTTAPRPGPAAPGAPTSEDCDCLSPPVPTPTSVPTVTPSDSGSASPSPSVSDDPSSSPATTSPTAEPSDSASSSAARSRHRRGNH